MALLSMINFGKNFPSCEQTKQQPYYTCPWRPALEYLGAIGTHMLSSGLLRENVDLAAQKLVFLDFK